MKGDNSIRLGDFGVSRILEYTDAMADTLIGSPFYTSPEIFEGRAYTSKTDIWSLGVLLYHIATLKYPIEAINHQVIAIAVVYFKGVPELPKQYSRTIKDLIDSMLQVDESKRPTINDILDHEAIQDRHENYESSSPK